MHSDAFTVSKPSPASTVRMDAQERSAVAESLVSNVAALHDASFGWALQCCGRHRDDAEEVLQQAYLKILEGRARFSGRSTFKTWLFAVIRKTAAEHRRKNYGRSRAVLRWLRGDQRLVIPERQVTDLLASERSRRLARALENLSKRQREVLHLVFYQDCTIEETAAVIDISVGSARTHYERGKRRLRELLAEEEGHETIG